METEQEIRLRMREFVVSNYLFGDESKAPGDAESLMDQGLIDSTGILELIEFLEGEFSISVTEAETVPENLGAIDALTRFVQVKRGSVQHGVRG